MEQTSPHRKMLIAAVSSCLMEHGIDSAEKELLETMTEMMQAFLVEVGNASKNYCELSGRSEPVIADVILGFVDMGIDFTRLSDYVKRFKHTVLPPLQPQQQPKQLNMLQAGTKHSLPTYIPSHFPPFPDPHAYIRTPTHKQPVIDYEAIREKFAVQKRDVEKALTKFLAKTNPTHNLFENDEIIFPLIACKSTLPPYINALLPQDQIFDLEDLEYKTEELNTPPRKRLKSEQKAEIKEETEVTEGEGEKVTEVAVKTEEATSQNSDIDNPYLAATKLPNKTGKDL